MNGFLNNLRYKFQQFMIGRYGIDEFYYFLLICYTILLVINCFVKSAGIYIALWIILIYSIFRLFSKNISARQKENARFLRAKFQFKKFYTQKKMQISDKQHVYRKCPACNATLRFPRRKGKHDAVCPRCKKSFKVFVLFENKK